MSNTQPNPAYENLLARSREINYLGGTASLLDWDQEVMMPKPAIAFRSQQSAQLARLLHELEIDPRIGEWLAQCAADKSLSADAGDSQAPAAANLREWSHSYARLTKLPGALVEEMARTRSLARGVWAEAREKDDFSLFRPWLEKTVHLQRQAADCYGWTDERWDALSEGYDPGVTAAQIEAVFTPLRGQLSRLVAELAQAPRRPRNKLLGRTAAIPQQQRFCRAMAQAIGFDLGRGRLDISTHPFCGGTCGDDVRMTTRFREDNLLDALSSTLHESGHGIYEQGLPPQHAGLPIGKAAWLSIHESQSRMWENLVGRSLAFWRWGIAPLRESFSDAAAGLTPDDFYESCNVVAPGFIRVDADEATYNLHIMVRFELERALISGDLAPADLPGAWREKYKAYLGLDVPNDRLGCLQDIHWSIGAFGYFPTYALGNLYAAQFFAKARQNMPDLLDQFAGGHFEGLKLWLTRNIHSRGQQFRSAELCLHVTGKTLSSDALLEHLAGKLRPLHGL